MVGICGVEGEHIEDSVTNKLKFVGNEDVCEYSNKVNLVSVTHPIHSINQPIKIGENIKLFVSGEIYGYSSENEYEKMPNILGDYEPFLQNKFQSEPNIIDFLTNLNGDFCGVILQENNIKLFSNKLATRPLYWTITSDGIVFSNLLTLVKKISKNKYDNKYLFEYFSANRSLGIKTPVRDVKMVPPGSILEYNMDTSSSNVRSYWSPKIEYTYSSYDKIVSDFTNIMGEVIDNYSSEQSRAGLYLSGGSDSRLIAGLTKDKLQAFHMNEFMNKEAKAAKSVARETNHNFRLLVRNSKYYDNILDEIDGVLDFNGGISEAYGVGFIQEIKKNADVLLSGQYADTVVGGLYYPQKSGNKWKTFPIHSGRPIKIKNVQEYYNQFTDGAIDRVRRPPEYFRSDFDWDDILSEEVFEKQDSILSHGIEYPSLESLIKFHNVYPITNVTNHIFYISSYHILPTRYPYLDDRVIEFISKVPPKYTVTKDIVRSAISATNNNLADIRHPSTDIPIKYPQYVHELGSFFGRVIEHLDINQPDLEEPYMTNGSWMDKGALIRQTSFGQQYIDDMSEEIDALKSLDNKLTTKNYDDHLSGKNNSNDIMKLISFLKFHEHSK